MILDTETLIAVMIALISSTGMLAFVLYKLYQFNK
jgi:hypothetical protein